MSTRTTSPRSIAVLGGTGNLGLGLAYRWAKAGHHIIIGSREKAKAETARDELSPRVPGGKIDGDENAAAARAAEIVAITVPFAAQMSTLQTIRPVVQGKLVIDTTVCLKPPKVGTVQLPPEGSASAITQKTLGADVRVVSAFQNVAAEILDSDAQIECDVLVCGNDKESCETVIALARDADLKALHAGPIENAAAVEGLTSILITLNRRYKVGHSGIQITGLKDH